VIKVTTNCMVRHIEGQGAETQAKLS